MPKRGAKLAIFRPAPEPIDFSPGMIRLQKAVTRLDKAREEVKNAWIEKREARAALIDELNGAGSITKREEEILEKVRQGSANKEIAANLFIETRTVKYHVSNLMRKFNVKSRLEL